MRIKMKHIKYYNNQLSKDRWQENPQQPKARCTSLFWWVPRITRAAMAEPTTPRQQFSLYYNYNILELLQLELTQYRRKDVCMQPARHN